MARHVNRLHPRYSNYLFIGIPLGKGLGHFSIEYNRKSGRQGNDDGDAGQCHVEIEHIASLVGQLRRVIDHDRIDCRGHFDLICIRHDDTNRYLALRLTVSG